MSNRAPERLDQCLVRLGIATSRRVARELIADGRVRVNGRRLPKGAGITPDDAVELIEPVPTLAIIPNQNLAVPTLYEDAAMVVVAKPGLMACYPLRADENRTVMNAVAARYPEAAFDGGNPLEGGLVHRLDNGTSGALMIARTQAARDTLRTALRRGEMRREYHALVAGNLREAVEVTTPIAHHRKNARKMVVASAVGGEERGRPAATALFPLRRYGAFTLVRAVPRSGNRHQIRVHLASLGYPLAGDDLYGGPALAELAPGRLWLHLAVLELESPAGGRLRLEAPLPADLTAALQAADS